MMCARPKLHRVTEVHRHLRRPTRREIHDLDCARMQFYLRDGVHTLQVQGAGIPARSHTRGKDQATQRHEDLLGEVGQQPASLCLVFDNADRSQETGLIADHACRAGPPDQVRQRQRHDRRRK